MNWLLCFLLCISTTIIVFGDNDAAGPAEYDDDYDEDDEDPYTTNSTINSTLIFIEKPRNYTVDVGAKYVKLICEVQNNLDNNNNNQNNNSSNNNNNNISKAQNHKVMFQWTLFNSPIDKESDKFNVKRIKVKQYDNRYRSVLRINDIEYFDRGFYECKASNGVDKLIAGAVLNVKNDPKWGITSSSSSSSSSSSDTLKFDQSDLTTYVPNLSNFPTLNLDQHQEQPHPNLNANNKGRKINNFDLEEAIKSGRIQKTFDLTPSGKLPLVPAKTIYNFTEPLCQIYNGRTCKNYLENQYVFVQPPYTQKEIEFKLSQAFLVISQSNDISSSCNKYAHPSLCFSAFPLCNDHRYINNYQIKHLKNNFDPNLQNNFHTIRNNLTGSLRRICKQDCLLLETELCSKEYAIAKGHPVISQTLDLEECQYLPDETEQSSKNCLSLGVNNQSNRDDTCYWDNGELYRGIQNHSETGQPCLRWAHQFQLTLSDHPELTGHNYCRNPGGIAPEPFCYIDQDKTEPCDVTKCSHFVKLYVIGISLAIGTLILIITTVQCCRRKSKTRNIQNINVPNADKNIYGNPGPNSPIEMNSLLPPNIPPQRNHHQSKNGGANGSGYQNVPQYTYKEVTFIEELGEGAFGKVYKGELRTKNGKIFVAVKSLKENASAKTQADFQREIELISELKHPNIICLMGVVVKQEPMCMLFEFMSEGDLHEFLIANSPSEGKSLTQNQFLHIAIQIAQGMEYLSENHYVHRDLAARNCLVSKDLIVKISDFGLSRDMYSCDYYRVQSKSLLPVRWMPPESILYGKFTTESDVWSYGVVLWEIYSYGLQPYYGYNNQEVINMIRSRKLLPCPDACPSYCYALMVECWAELAIRRPSFAELAHRLRVWKQNGNSNGAYYRINNSCNNEQQNSGQHRYNSTSSPAAGTAGNTFSIAPSCGGSSTTKSMSHMSDSPTVCCPIEHNMENTWERGLSLSKTGRLNESQSSLTSRSSSLGNKTQSTNLSNEHSSTKHRRSHRRNDESLERGISHKNTIVNSTGDNFEIKITH